MPVLAALRRQEVPKLEDHEAEASLGYTVSTATAA